MGNKYKGVMAWGTERIVFKKLSLDSKQMESRNKLAKIASVRSGKADADNTGPKQ
jgi:hypothetical protein